MNSLCYISLKELISKLQWLNLLNEVHSLNVCCVANLQKKVYFSLKLLLLLLSPLIRMLLTIVAKIPKTMSH